MLVHTVEQVLYGAAVGSINAVIWYCFTSLFVRPFYPALVELPIAKFFLIRDCSHIPELVRFEYEQTFAANSSLREKLKSI